MGDTILIETTADEVVSIVTAGPQGPSGAEAATLTTTGDLLYRAALANDRLPIGGEGQVLKVASGLPAWGDESGAVTEVNGQTGAVTLTASDVGAAPATGISPSAISGTAVVDSDARLSDSRTPTTHAASHATAGSDPLAPSDIGAAWAQVLSNQTVTGNTLLSAGRNRRITLFAYGVTANVDLPYENNEAGDVVTLLANFSVASTLTIRSASVMSGGVPLAYQTLATLNASGQSFTFVSDGTATGWSLRAPASHTHAASDITSGTLTHERGGLEADVSAYSGLVKIDAGSTSAVTVTSAGEALLDDADASAQRTTLGLGNSATLDTGTTAGTVAEGDHTHELANLDATGATDGHVLTADGAGGAAWEAVPAGDTVSINASAADVLSVASGEISAVDATADKIVFWDDSASELTYLALGSGLSITDQTISATASGGSKTYATFTATDNQPPASNYATLDTRNSIAVLDFDDATDESAMFVGIIPEGASLGSGLKIRLHWMATSATSGDVIWDVSLERMTTDLDSDSFDTIASGTATANGTSGILTVTEITLTTIDSVTAGDGYRLKVTRDANNASDTMSGDAELVVVEVRSAA